MRRASRRELESHRSARSARTMESLGSTSLTVTAPEVAQLVAHYLESSFPATGRLFAKEASSLARAAAAAVVVAQAARGGRRGVRGALGGARAGAQQFRAIRNFCARNSHHLPRRAQRRRFERAFGGDDALVRRCLANVATLLDDYVAATRPQRAPGRSRKSERPQRRQQADEPVSSRRLFGQRAMADAAMAAAAAAPPPPDAAAAAAPPPGAASSSSAAAASSSSSAAASSSSAAVPPAADWLAQHINESSSAPAKQMSVDEIVRSLLADPQASTMLDSLAHGAAAAEEGGAAAAAAAAAPAEEADSAAAAAAPRPSATAGARARRRRSGGGTRRRAARMDQAKA